MSTATPQELLHLWAREQLSTEMATGQVLQHLVSMQTSLDAIKQRLTALQTQIDNLSPSDKQAIAGAKKESPSKGRR
jgi:hypothetical protein